jgi:hypothetical protein
MRNPLAKHQPRRPWDKDHIADAAKAAYHQHGVLCVALDDLGEFDRLAAEAIGNKLYGERAK